MNKLHKQNFCIDRFRELGDRDGFDENLGIKAFVVALDVFDDRDLLEEFKCFHRCIIPQLVGNVHIFIQPAVFDCRIGFEPTFPLADLQSPCFHPNRTESYPRSGVLSAVLTTNLLLDNVNS